MRISLLIHVDDVHDDVDEIENNDKDVNVNGRLCRPPTRVDS